MLCTNHMDVKNIKVTMETSTSMTETTCIECCRALSSRGASWVLLRQMPPDNVPLAIPKNGMVRLNHRARHQLPARLALWRRDSGALPECHGAA